MKKKFKTQNRNRSTEQGGKENRAILTQNKYLKCNTDFWDIEQMFQIGNNSFDKHQKLLLFPALLKN